MLEELFELRLAMRDKKPKEEVIKKYNLYLKSYEDSEKDLRDKIDFRDFTEKYKEYIKNDNTL
jgi:hypothetical protein